MSVECVAGHQPGRVVVEVEERAVQEGHGVRVTAGRSSALAHKRFLPQHNVRLNSATRYITPKDMLAGRQEQIHAERDRKLETARQERQVRRQQAA